MNDPEEGTVSLEKEAEQVTACCGTGTGAFTGTGTGIGTEIGTGTGTFPSEGKLVEAWKLVGGQMPPPGHQLEGNRF